MSRNTRLRMRSTRELRRWLLVALVMALSSADGQQKNGQPPDANILLRQTRAAEAGDCSSNVTVKGSGGTLTSPNYPGNYPASIECRWLLNTAEPNVTVLLKIDTLATEPDTNCRLDYLQVYLGATTLAPSLGRFCGSVHNRLLKTNASTVLLVFRSDPVYEDQGFSLDYFTQSSADCPALLTDGSGSLRSPGFPDNYPDHTDCWTVIRVGEGKKVTLFFDSVDMEYGENCTFDYVQVFDGDARDSPLLGQICRYSDVRHFESSSNAILVRFHSDDSVSQKGYRARYASVDMRSFPTGECLWEAGEVNGTIASPNYPSNYPSSSNCSIWILAPEGSTVFFTFDALQMEMDPKCSFDFLQVEETSPAGTAVLGRLCGNQGEPKNLTSSQNEVHVRFQSDDFAEFSGFKLRYWFLGIGSKEKIVSTGLGSSEKLTFSEVPRNATIPLGSSYMLHCSTRHPAAKLHWLKDDALLADGNPMAGLKLLPNHTLWIQSMDHPLAGVYSCVAVSVEETITAEANVIVRDQPLVDDESCGIVFRKTPRDSYFSEGEFGHLECLAAGTQVLVSWEKDGQPLPTGGRVTVLKNGYIFMDKVGQDDAGVYTCVVHDEAIGCERRASALLQVSPRIKVEEVCGRPNAGQPATNITRDDHGKIIGGHDARKGAYPWQVMLWEPTLGSFCGATLLNERWVATAAHCFINYRNLRWDRVVIKFGKHDREREEEHEFRTGIADPSSIVVHPAYNRLTFDNDLALLRLREHVHFTDYILPVCLADRELGEVLLRRSGSNLRLGTVIGWGKLKDNGPSPRFLQEVVLPVVDQDVCLRSTNYTVTRNMFCAGYTQEILGDACHGDSGGPFLVQHSGKWFLMGVVSWGEGCGTENKYGFYTRVPNYASWIRGIIKS